MLTNYFPFTRQFDFKFSFCSNLKHLTEREITQTFEEFDKIHMKMCQEFSQTPDHLIEPRTQNIDYLLILSELLTETQKHEMYRKIRDEMFNHERNIFGSNVS